MKRCLSVLLTAVAAGLCAADPATLRLTAYVNVSSGCQKPTEALLHELAAKYAGRLKVDLVDFGEPEGRRRWLGDGMHCMSIALNGSPRADIVFRGVPVTVTFQMPPGHLWLLEELETAVRQKLDGVSDQDRKGPEISAKTLPDSAAVQADGQAILDELTEPEARRLCGVLQAAAGAKPLVQDDFALDVVDGMAKVSLRGEPLADLGLVGIPAPADAETKATARFLRLIGPFARISRPFPGSAPRQPKP